MDNNELATIIVNLIITDLRDRRGFKFLLESIELEDKETYDEIIATLLQITENMLILNKN